MAVLECATDIPNSTTALKLHNAKKDTRQLNSRQVSHSSSSADIRFFRENKKTETANNAINIKTTTSKIAPIPDSIFNPRL
jgi:hypothetical protein